VEEGGLDRLPAKTRVEGAGGAGDQPKGGDAGGAGGRLRSSDEVRGVAATAKFGRNEQIGEPGREAGAGFEAGGREGNVPREGSMPLGACRAGWQAGRKQDEAEFRAEGRQAALAEPGKEGRQEVGPFGERDEGRGHGQTGKSGTKTPRAKQAGGAGDAGGGEALDGGSSRGRAGSAAPIPAMCIGTAAGKRTSASGGEEPQQHPGKVER